jgi:predicted peptidase
MPAVVATVLLAASVLLGVATPDLPTFFEAKEYRYTGGHYKQELFRYRLFVPRNIKPKERCPILVWLHGLGENGSDNVKSLAHLDLVLTDLAHVEKYRFFILVAQCPSANPYWFNRAEPVDDMINVAVEILRKTLREQPIDESRIYLSGLSAGGNGCWEMAMRHPELFAAVVPMASGGGDLSRVANLIDIPIWAFHNTKDDGVPADGDRETATAIEAAGGNVHLTLIRAEGHDCWTKTFQYYNIMTWILEQKRGAWICWRPPGFRQRTWHIMATPAAFLILVWLGWCSERRRRQKRIADNVLTTNTMQWEGAL